MVNMVKDAGIDRPLLIVTLTLLVVGMLMIYSSTMIVAKEKYGDSFYLFRKQLLWLAAALPVFFWLLFLKKPHYTRARFIFPALGLSVVLLFLVFLMGPVNHTYRWIRFAGMSLQPSELAKIVVVLYLSYVFSQENFTVNNPRHLFLALLPVGVIEGLILKEPDFGNFALVLMVVAVMLFICGLKLRYFAVLLLLVVPLLVVLIKMDPLRSSRIMGFLNPEAHASTYNFQAQQSIYAVGSGGLFGQGVGNSTQKLFFLPYAYTDFIYAIVGEELGMLGALTILALFLAFFLRGLAIARRFTQTQPRLLVLGLTFLVVSQALINISVTIGIFPTKGIPLPFISSGGTSLLGSLIASALLLNISSLSKGEFLS